MATKAQRQHLAALMDWLVANEPRIDYTQKRPMATDHWLEQALATHLHKGHKITMDCSESVTLLCRMAGLADPNGRGYDGFGFTGSLLEHLTSYTDPGAADTGALVVFGPGTGDHVCMVRHAGKDPVLFSHGQKSGPAYYPLSVQKRAHRAPTRFLSVAGL